MYSAFKEPLNYLKFNENVALKEWRSLKNYVKSNFRIGDHIKAFDVWQKIFKFKRVDYPNMCLLSKIIISLSASNSTAERAFNILSLLLSDRRLSMKYSTIEKLLLLNVNDKNWCDVEREELIEQAVEMYLKKTAHNECPNNRTT